MSYYPAGSGTEPRPRIPSWVCSTCGSANVVSTLTLDAEWAVGKCGRCTQARQLIAGYVWVRYDRPEPWLPDWMYAV